MARRRGRKIRRRRDTRFNLLNAVEGAVYGSIITKAAFNTDLINFFIGDRADAGVQLKQLLANPQASLDQIQNRLMDPTVVVNAAISGVVSGILFNVFSKALSKPRRKVNASLKQLGVPVKM